MAIQYWFDLYPRDNPKNGARLVRFTKLQSAEYRGVANGTGAGNFSIRADTAEAQNIDPRGLQYVRVVEEDTVAVTETVVGGFFLDNGDFQLLDERGTRLLRFGGAGTLSYLARSVMAPHTYIHDVFTGQDPFDDTWRLYAQSTVYANGNYLGAMLWRVIYEAQHFRNTATYTHRHADGLTYTDSHDDDRLASAIPDLVMDFTQFLDSSGVAWDQSSGEFKAQTNENVLAIVQRLMQAGLYVEMDPDTFELRAWQADDHRRTRTGVAWGATVVRFQAPTDGTIATGNIASDAVRKISAFIKRSLLWVGGQDIYSKVTGTTDIPWEGGVYSDTQDTTALTQIGNVQIDARDDAGDVLRIVQLISDNPTGGRYKPFRSTGVLLDDLVTVHTGTNQFDHNEQNFPVAAITVMLRVGGDWEAIYELGASFAAAQSRQFQVTPVPSHTHPPNPRLCTSEDALRGLAIGSIKSSGDESGWPRTNVVDGNDAASSHWSATPLASGVADMWIAFDAGAVRLIDAARILTDTDGSEDTPQNIATEARLYGTNDPDVWAALTHGSGKMTTDPTDHGWGHVATLTSALSEPSDTRIGFDAAPYRYWMWKAIAGGTSEWDVNTMELWTSVGTSPKASRCGHGHGAHEIAFAGAASGSTATTVQERLDEIGEVIGGPSPSAAGWSRPETPFDVHDLPRGYNLTKQGIVIERGASSSWKEALVESPNVFWSPEAGKYAMVFVGYSGTPASPTEGAIGVATADSPDGPWTEYGSNPFFSKSGAGDDSHGTSGPFVWYEDETYHLFYIGLTAGGYEGGTKTICYATSTDWVPGTNAGTWTRAGAVISPFGSGWRQTAIWHPNIVKRGSTYYLFFNAGDGTSESIGYATSTDLATWTVDDVNSPVLEKGSGTWDGSHVGDPYVYRLGETWYMAYFGFDGTNASDGLAFTSDADFPLGWTKFAGNPVLIFGGADDSKHAHKPSIWITPTKHYHWYTAVTTASPEKREIALATEELASPPSGPAGGDLSGTYPNPSVVDDSHVHTAATISGVSGGHILLADGRATPFTFNDLLQADDGSDFLWND